MLPKHVGWYDQPGQQTPTQTEDPSAPCPLCGNILGQRGKRADGKSRLFITSLMGMDRTRSYFYAVHRDCHETATDDQIADIESVIIDGCH